MVGTVNDDSTPPDDSISRIDALALVGGSMGYDEAEAADYLADCARGPLGQRRVEWTSHNEIIIDCVVGPPSLEENRPRPPSPEQLEQVIRSRLWEQARRGEPGVHVKSNSATYRAAVVFVKPFGAWQLVSAPERGATPTTPEWSVEINFKLIKFRLSQLVAALRSDGGLFEAGLERLRALGRLPSAVAAIIDPPTGPTSTNPIPICQRGKAPQWVEQMLKHDNYSSKNLGQYEYVDKVLLPHKPPVGRDRLCNIVSEIVREGLKPGGLKLWQGKLIEQAKKAPPLGPKRRLPPLRKGGS